MRTVEDSHSAGRASYSSFDISGVNFRAKQIPLRYTTRAGFLQGEPASKGALMSVICVSLYDRLCLKCSYQAHAHVLGMIVKMRCAFLHSSEYAFIAIDGL